MKKTILLALALLLALVMFGGCGEDGKIENKPSNDSASTDDQAGGNNQMDGQDSMMKYDADWLSFDVPDSWRKNFKSVTSEVGSGDNKYKKTDFFYSEGERDINIMSVGRFTKQQWEDLKKKDPKTEEAKLGESKAGDYVYSIFYENHDYVEDSELREILKNIRNDATSLRSAIRLK